MKITLKTMKLPFRKLKLKSRMMFILGLMALLQTSMLGLFALQYLNQSLNDEIGVRALHVAKTIAAMPEVANAVKRSDTNYLQPLSLTLAQEIHARFVVIGDAAGLRRHWSLSALPASGRSDWKHGRWTWKLNGII